MRIWSGERSVLKNCKRKRGNLLSPPDFAQAIEISLALYMDENIPRSITTGLRLRGVDVLTVQEEGRTSFTDPIILDRATELQRVLF